MSDVRRRYRLLALVPILVAAALLAQRSATAQQPRPLTLDALYHPEKKVEFSVPRPTLTWLDDDYYVAQGGRGAGGAGSGSGGVTGGSEARAPAAPPKRRQRAAGRPHRQGARPDRQERAVVRRVEADRRLARVPGVTADEAKRLARPRLANFNPARTGLLVTIGDDLYHYEVAADRLTRLTHAAGKEEEPNFSPDGRMVAFVRDYNLHVADVATGTERALTTDGKAAPNGEGIILNGKLDWVYQEEIYGRGTYKAYWWSPDSTRLAFLQLDETPVHEFTVVDHIPYRQALETFDYPKAGDPNPNVKLGVVRVTGGDVDWIDLDSYSASEFLIVDVTWRPDSRAMVYQVQDREQTWLDLNAAPIDRRCAEAPDSRDEQGLGEPSGRQRHVAEGRLVHLAERAHRLQAPLSLQGGRHADPADHRRPLGSAHAARRGRDRTGSSTSRGPSAARSAAISIASSSMAWN